MNIEQLQWKTESGWCILSGELANKTDLVLAFGAREVISNPERYHELKSRYQPDHCIMCSTSGEICGEEVSDDGITAVAIHFDKTRIAVVESDLQEEPDSGKTGAKLAAKLTHDDLKHVFVISDGQDINASYLVEGLKENLPKDITITGGLAGDGAHFETTVVGYNNVPQSGRVVALGFYGEHIRVGHGIQGGWDKFGPERLVTKSKDNVLYEVDGKSVLDLYKKYLGPHADDLPGSALKFPLSLKRDENDDTLVRTILSIDEDEHSMMFAGNIPEGATVRFMKANFDRLIDGAANAAESSRNKIRNTKPELAILISCVGRKLILGPRVDEEVEAVMETLGGNPVITGFYSYGEIAPLRDHAGCELHNQTMTITTFSEV